MGPERTPAANIPQAEAITSAEADPNPSLLAVFGGETITYKGLSAPLGLLVDLCPIPKEEKAAWSTEKIDNYAIGILDEAGFDWRSRLDAPEVERIETAVAQYRLGAEDEKKN